MDPATDLRRADSLHAERRHSEAIEAYRSVLACNPSLLDAWYGLGCACLATEAYGAAADALRQAVALRPDAVGARCSLAEALFGLGDLEAAVPHFQHVIETGQGEVRAAALTTLASIAPGAPGLDNAAVLTVRRRWLAQAARDIHPMPPAPRQMLRRLPGQRLRIGYVSAFFGARNWMKPVWGVINRHDRARFEIHLLSDGDDPSAASGYRDHPDDRVWQIAGLSNAALAGHIRQAGLDVLVDLNGYSRPARLPLFLARAAPRQVAWFNMYATSGLPSFDALVGDAAVLPLAEAAHYSEPVVRVPGSYLAFEVTYPVPGIAPPPALRNGWLTFGCFGSAYKLTDGVIAAWCRILAAAPESRLLLCNRSLDDPSNRTALLARFAGHSVAAARLTLQGGAEHAAFLRGYDSVDVALDTFPYNGGTTTMEALWQGVPVLSFNGDRWAARTSRSLLVAAGLEDWVAADEAAYVAAAVRLAQDPQIPARLAALRAGMRAQLAASAACDCAALCRSLEAVYAAPAAAG